MQLFVVMMAILAGSSIAEDSLQVDRRSPITGFAQVFERFVTGFFQDESGFKDECNYFPKLTAFSDPNIFYLSEILNNFMCESGFTKKLNKIAEGVNLLLKVILTKRPNKEEQNMKIESTTAAEETTTTAEETTTTTVTTTTVKGFVNREALYVSASLSTGSAILVYERTDSAPYFISPKVLPIAEDARSMMVDAARKHLVVVISNELLIDVFNYDSATGRYSTEKSKTFDSGYLQQAVLDSTGKYLLVSKVDTAEIFVFELLEDGTLANKTIYDPVLTEFDANPQMLVFHPKAKLVLAEVYQDQDKVVFLNFNPTTATLTKLTKEADLPDSSRPSRVVFSKDGDYMYVACKTHKVFTFKVTVNEATNDVTAIERKGSIDTSEDSDVESYDVEMVIHPEGSYLYVFDFYASAIAMYKIDLTTGELTSNGYQKVTDNSPTDIVLTADGTMLILASADGVTSFKVNPEDGKLNDKQTIAKDYAAVKLYYG